MKKFSLSVVALAASAACGTAFASTDFTTTTPSGATAMARELSYGTATPITTNTRTQIVSRLGFGVDRLQNRHIKITLSGGGAAIAAATAGANVAFTPGAGGTCGTGTTATWVGGGLGSANVIYQITGGSRGCTATDVVTVTLPAVSVTSNTTVQALYELFDTAGDAVNGTNRLSPNATPANFLTFVAGLASPTLAAANQEIAIGAAPNTYVQFAVGGNGPVSLGTIQLGVVPNVAAQGGTVTLANLASSTSAVVFGTNSEFGSGSSLKVINTAGGEAACSGGSALTLNAARTSASFAIGNSGDIHRLCWSVSGNQPINPQTVTADYTPVQTGTTLTDPPAASLSTVTRAGTTLSSPYVTINSSYNTAFTLRNTSGSVVNWTATVTPENAVGSTTGVCAAGTLTGQIPANGIAIVNARTICPSISGAVNNNRAAFSFAVEAPQANIEGSMTTSTIGGASTPNTMLMIRNGSY
jgi:hypothetical protein